MSTESAPESFKSLMNPWAEDGELLNSRRGSIKRVPPHSLQLIKELAIFKLILKD